MKPVPRPKPVACIRAPNGYSYCDRNPAGEFVFYDAKYAAEMYDARMRDNVPIVACEKCCDEVYRRADAETSERR